MPMPALVDFLMDQFLADKFVATTLKDHAEPAGNLDEFRLFAKNYLRENPPVQLGLAVENNYIIKLKNGTEVLIAPDNADQEHPGRSTSAVDSSGSVPISKGL